MPPVVTTAASNQSTPLRQNEADTQAFSVQPLTSNVHRVLSRALISRIEDTQPIARGALSVGTPATSTLGSFSPLPESMGAESAALIVASARENPTAWRETIPTLHVTGSQANLAVFNTRRGLHFSTPSALEILRAMSGSRSHQRDGVSGTLLRSPIGLNRALDCIGASAYGHVAAVPPRNLPFEHMHALLAPWDHKGLVIFENQCRAMMRP
jgi:hypothetical protein